MHRNDRRSPAAQRPLAQIKLVEGDAVQILPVKSERMEVAIALAAPIDEFDAELERTPSLGKEFVLRNAEHGIEFANRRDGRLSHADRPDRIGFDQRDPPLPVVEIARKRGRGHPAGRSTADDHDIPNARSVTVTFTHRPLAEPPSEVFLQQIYPYLLRSLLQRPQQTDMHRNSRTSASRGFVVALT